MAEIINCGFKEMCYPVGLNMSSNITTIEQYCNIIQREYSNKPIMLHCMGSSGAIIAGIIAYKKDNVIINHIKKDGENSHNSRVQTFIDMYNNIIVDDIVASGSTVRDILCKYPNDCIFDALFVSNRCSEMFYSAVKDRIKRLYIQ